MRHFSRPGHPGPPLFPTTYKIHLLATLVKPQEQRQNTTQKVKRNNQDNFYQLKTVKDDLLAFSWKKLCFSSSCRPGGWLIQF